MLTYLAVVSGRGIDDEYAATVDRLAETFLPFHPHVRHRSVWFSPRRDVALWIWDNGPSTWPRAFHSEPGGALAFSGYVHDRGTLLDGPAMFERAGADIRHLGGAFGLVRVDPSGLRAWNTRARLEHVAWCEGSGRIVVSNRALAAHLVANRTATPEYDATFLRTMLMAGFPTSERTAFAGVRLLPPQSSLWVTPRRVVVTSGSWPDRTDDPESAASALKESLEQSVAFVEQVDSAPRSALTGGKDSRLVAAALSAADVDFSAVTGGLDEHPDVVIAARVAELLGVEHLRTRPGVTDGTGRPSFLEHHVLADSCRRLFGSDGAHSVFESISRDVRVRANEGVVLGGQGGELVRGGYAKQPVDRHRDARSKLETIALRHESRLTGRAGRAERIRLLAWHLSNRDRSDASSALWRYYVQFRSGRWAAAGWAAASIGRPRIWPYFDAQVVEACARIPSQHRIDERAIVEVLRSMRPELVDLPLVGARWNHDETPPAGEGRAAWEQRAPIQAPPGKASFDWRYQFSSGLGDLIAEFVHPILDRDEIAPVVDVEHAQTVLGRAVDGGLDGDRSSGYYLWTLFSVGLLLSNLWLEPDPPKTTIRFPIPEA